MSISEYGYGIVNDYFTAGEVGELGFPCCSCKHKLIDRTSYPCCFCGHNEDAEESYNCSLCGVLQKGNPYTDGKTIAIGTPSQLSYVCVNCYNTIKEDLC